jgi:hypothetical protein
MDLQEAARRLRDTPLDPSIGLALASRSIRDNPIKTILDELCKLREEPAVVTRQKRRKTDKRTVVKRTRLSKKERRQLLGRPEDSTLKAQYYHLRREVLRRWKKQVRLSLPLTTSWEWNLSLHEWVNMWGSCPAVEVGLNTYKPAWLVRGRKADKDVQLKRIDTSKPWRRDNLLIARGKLILYTPSSSPTDVEQKGKVILYAPYDSSDSVE